MDPTIASLLGVALGGFFSLASAGLTLFATRKKRKHEEDNLLLQNIQIMKDFGLDISKYLDDFRKSMEEQAESMRLERERAQQELATQVSEVKEYVAEVKPLLVKITATPAVAHAKGNEATVETNDKTDDGERVEVKDEVSGIEVVTPSAEADAIAPTPSVETGSPEE